MDLSAGQRSGYWGCSSVGRAPDLHSGGRRFDPDQLHHGAGSPPRFESRVNEPCPGRVKDVWARLIYAIKRSLTREE